MFLLLGHITWDPVFVQYETRTLKKKSLVATIPSLEKEWRVVFEVRAKKTKDARNILHMTTGGEGSSALNSIPSVFLHKGFEVTFPINGETLENKFPQSANVKIRQHWYEIQIMQVLEDSKYIFGVFFTFS